MSSASDTLEGMLEDIMRLPHDPMAHQLIAPLGMVLLCVKDLERRLDLIDGDNAGLVLLKLKELELRIKDLETFQQAHSELERFRRIRNNRQ